MTSDTKTVRFWREPFSTASHLAGCVLSVVALVFLIQAAGNRTLHLIGALAFGFSLILLYLASTLYHGVVASPRTLNHLVRLDHIAIFLLILGTYVPVCLVTLSGPWGWGLLAVEGVLALIGILMVVLRRETAPPKHLRIHEGVRLGLSLVMGWMAVAFAGPLFRTLTPDGAFWLVGGGVVYSLGAVVFATDRPHLWPGKFSAHDLWHCFVLGGSSLHFAFILRHVFASGAH